MIAYFDCFSGISGDMTLAAFIHLGVPAAFLNETISSLPLSGFSIKARTMMRNHISATLVDVDVAEDQPERDYQTIKHLIENSPLDDRVKNLSLGIFKRIAVAESRIHQVSPDKVHFHEIGAVDSVVDIVGAALCIHYLNIREVHAAFPALGSGFVNCSHGRLPVPAPATLEILKGIPVAPGHAPMELTTPTGAAILAELCHSFGPMPVMQVKEIGYGAGHKAIENSPNILRIVLGDQQQNQHQDMVYVLETAVDDMNPEITGYVVERLFENGALDVLVFPVQMKKNRPGSFLQVLSAPKDRDSLLELLFKETTTLGIRHHAVFRTVLNRKSVTRDTALGPVEFKEIETIDGQSFLAPEYESLKKIAKTRSLPLKKVYEIVSGKSHENIG